jgi:hypothetical protein
MWFFKKPLWHGLTTKPTKLTRRRPNKSSPTNPTYIFCHPPSSPPTLITLPKGRCRFPPPRRWHTFLSCLVIAAATHPYPPSLVPRSLLTAGLQPPPYSDLVPLAVGGAWPVGATVPSDGFFIFFENYLPRAKLYSVGLGAALGKWSFVDQIVSWALCHEQALGIACVVSKDACAVSHARCPVYRSGDGVALTSQSSRRTVVLTVLTASPPMTLGTSTESPHWCRCCPRAQSCLPCS